MTAGKMNCLNLYFRCAVEGTVTLNEESSDFVWLTMPEALARKPIFGAEQAVRRVMAKAE
jgi:hypothetical protein